MLEADIYQLLTKINKQARHRSLSETINYVIRAYMNIIADQAKQQEEQPIKKKPKKAIDSLEDKYGIKRYD
jgi:GTP cyclohydrolase I